MSTFTLDQIWETFLQQLRHVDNNLTTNTISYQTFIYLRWDGPREPLEQALQNAAGRAMRGKIVTASIRYVRMTDLKEYVYAVRFLVPLRKRFCCGNGCTDCIRLKS
ncbi:hypothetical protein ACE1TF_01785 [Geomicrobium sp. JSM 1781026]|uniref:hypothetical protein n=1 Tax=Geomicrobium sp. JSM 1781026 TaxID=3344580 RepID=UPI0035C2172F